MPQAIHEGRSYLIKADINYHNDLIDDIKTEELPRVYRTIRGLEVE